MGDSTLPVQITVEASLDQTGALLGIVVEGDTILRLPMNAAQPDHLIEMSGNARARLKDEVPERVDLTKPMPSIREVNMVVGYEPSCGLKAIAIRDPSYGWTQYLLHDALAAKAGEILLRDHRS